MNIYKRHLESKGEHIFLLPGFLITESKYKNSFIDGYPNAAGHMIIAQEMFQVLLPLLNKM